jgi:hypothetical protein
MPRPTKEVALNTLTKLNTHECPFCSFEGKGVGTHWQMSDCPNPIPDSSGKDLLKGILMRDGTLLRDGKYPRIEIVSINKEFLEYLSNIFGPIMSDVSLRMKASELADINRERNFTSTVNEDNYHDQYRCRTKSLVKMNKLRSWYDSGKKRFNTVNCVTPEILSMWYCSDGTLSWSIKPEHSTYRISISINSQTDRPKEIKSLFNNLNVDPRISSNTLYFTKSDSDKLLSYMQPVPDGMEYKFENTSVEMYKSKKNNSTSKKILR